MMKGTFNKFAKNKFSLFGPLLIIAVISAALFYYKEAKAPADNPDIIGAPANQNENQGSPQEKNEPNIKIYEPIADQEIGLPFSIKGEARVFESTFNYRLKDGEGKVLVENHAMSNAPDIGEFGSFSLIVFSYPQSNSQKGTLEVFWFSPQDGSELDKVIIPVNFAQVETISLKAFFGNSQKDPNSLNCSKAYPVERRIAKTDLVATAALEQLLTGPNTIETNEGFFTSINPGTKLNSIKIKSGVAYADFNQMLDLQVAGSCRVSAIRAQIESTLKQFSTVKSVVISIDGRTKDILQP